MDEVRYLVAQIEKLRPFPEVPEALARLKCRYRLIVLSNGDPDMLEAAKRHHRIAFDDVISAAVAGTFKPHVRTYTRAAELARVRVEEVLFVANWGGSSPLSMGQLGKIRDEPEHSAEGGSLRAMARAG